MVENFIKGASLGKVLITLMTSLFILWSSYWAEKIHENNSSGVTRFDAVPHHQGPLWMPGSEADPLQPNQSFINTFSGSLQVFINWMCTGFRKTTLSNHRDASSLFLFSKREFFPGRSSGHGLFLFARISTSLQWYLSHHTHAIRCDFFIFEKEVACLSQHGRWDSRIIYQLFWKHCLGDPPIPVRRGTFSRKSPPDLSSMRSTFERFFSSTVWIVKWLISLTTLPP